MAPAIQDNGLSIRENCCCPVCNAPSSGYRRQINDIYSVLKCGNCGLEYTDPLPTREQLEIFYTNYQDIRADAKVVIMNAKKNLKHLSARYGLSNSSRILDFGCGVGLFVNIAGQNCVGVDPFYADGQRILADIQDLNESQFDFITLWGALEHLADPLNSINKLAMKLVNGGLIALTTIDAEGIIPYYYKPPEHLTYWTHAAFNLLASNCGLELIEYKPYKMLQLGSVYLDRLLSRTPQNYKKYFQLKLPEVVLVPTNEIFVVYKKK